jgi:hypothetical protein
MRGVYRSRYVVVGVLLVADYYRGLSEFFCRFSQNLTLVLNVFARREAISAVRGILLAISAWSGEYTQIHD